MRPPVCEICDLALDPDDVDAGLVTFRPDDASIEWHRRADAEPGFVGHPPDMGWFCGDHVAAAREAALTRSFVDGVRHVEAHARFVDVTTLAFADPDGVAQTTAIPPRSSDGVRRILHDHRSELESALGPPAATLRSSTSFRLDGEHDRSVAHSTAGPCDLFDRVEYRRDGAELVAWLVELRVEQRGSVLAVVRIAPFDRLQTWIADERLRSWVESLAATLSTSPPDLLDPGPDLVGVDLGSGRLGASDGFDLTWVEWDVAAVDVHELARHLHAALADLFAARQLGAPPALVTTTERTWSPMDGAEPPYCPFTDTTVSAATAGDGTMVSLQVVTNHWNDDDVSGATVSLAIEGHVSVAAFGSNDGGRSITTLRLYRPTSSAVVGVIDRLVDNAAAG